MRGWIESRRRFPRVAAVATLVITFALVALAFLQASKPVTATSTRASHVYLPFIGDAASGEH